MLHFTIIRLDYLNRLEKPCSLQSAYILKTQITPYCLHENDFMTFLSLVA